MKKKSSARRKTPRPPATEAAPPETAQPRSLVEQVTERVDQEAADRGGSEEHRLGRKLVEELGLTPGETPERPSLVEQVTRRVDQEAADRGGSEEQRLRRKLVEESGLRPGPKVESPKRGKGGDA